MLITNDFKGLLGYGQATKNIPLVHLWFSLNVKNVVLSYCSRELSNMVLFISDLRRTWKQKSEEVEEIEASIEDETMFTVSISF